MKPQSITFSPLRRHVRPVSTPAVVFRPVGRWRRLQRAAWRLLRDTGALEAYFERTVEFRRVDLRRGDFIDTILHAVAEITNQYGGERPKECFIGPDEMETLLREPRLRDLLIQSGSLTSFHVEGYLGYRGFTRLYGVRVTVVPHMKGMLVL